MVEFINEAVSVEVRGAERGASTPTAFVWRERRYQIESWGRQNIETRDGRSVRCHLVQTANFETWELCQDTKTAQWTLSRHWARKPRAL